MQGYEQVVELTTPVPTEILAQIGEYLSLWDLGNLATCNKNLFSIFISKVWNKLIINNKNSKQLVYLIDQIKNDKKFDFLSLVEQVEFDRFLTKTGLNDEYLMENDTIKILNSLKNVKLLKIVTPPLETDVGIVLRKMEKRLGIELNLHVMCDEREPGNFAKFRNIKSLTLENVYDGIDHLMPLPGCVENLDIRAHSTCAYSRVLGKFMSNCVKLPTLRISELSIGIDKSSAWIPDSTTTLELRDCQIHVSNTVTKRPQMNGIKKLKILDDYSKIDNMVLPELESLELCSKRGSFLTSVKPANVPMLNTLVYSGVNISSIISSVMHANDQLMMMNVENLKIDLSVADGDKENGRIEELVNILNTRVGNLKMLVMNIDSNDDDDLYNELHASMERLNAKVSLNASF